MTENGWYCGRCRYWHRPDKKKGEIGQCRRHPPQVVAEDLGDIETEWPETYSDDWCGDFEATADR